MRLKITPDDQTKDQLAQIASGYRMIVVGLTAVALALALALIGVLANAH